MQEERSDRGRLPLAFCIIGRTGMPISAFCPGFLIFRLTFWENVDIIKRIDSFGKLWHGAESFGIYIL